MLGEEEFMQQLIDLQQALATQSQPIPVPREEPFLLQFTERTGEPALNVSPEFALEVGAVDAPQFHLKNEFPNHPLFMGGRQGAVNRKLPLLELVDVVCEFVFVLKV